MKAKKGWWAQATAGVFSAPIKKHTDNLYLGDTIYQYSAKEPR